MSKKTEPAVLPPASNPPEAPDIAEIARENVETRLHNLEAFVEQLAGKVSTLREDHQALEARTGAALEDLESLPTMIEGRLTASLEIFDRLGRNLERLVDQLEQGALRPPTATAPPASAARPNVVQGKPPASAAAAGPSVVQAVPPASASAAKPNVVQGKGPARPPASASKAGAAPRTPKPPGSNRQSFQPPPGALQHPVPVEGSSPAPAPGGTTLAGAVDVARQFTGLLEQGRALGKALDPTVRGLLEARIGAFEKEIEGVMKLIG